MDTGLIWNVGLTIGMAILSGFGWLGARLLNQIKQALEDRMEQHGEQIEKVNNKIENAQEELNAYKIIVQRKFVNQEDYVRTTQGLDAKIERIFKEISKINVNVARIATMQEVEQDDRG